MVNICFWRIAASFLSPLRAVSVALKFWVALAWLSDKKPMTSIEVNKTKTDIMRTYRLLVRPPSFCQFRYRWVTVRILPISMPRPIHIIIEALLANTDINPYTDMYTELPATNSRLIVTRMGYMVHTSLFFRDKLVVTD